MSIGDALNKRKIIAIILISLFILVAIKLIYNLYDATDSAPTKINGFSSKNNDVVFQVYPIENQITLSVDNRNKNLPKTTSEASESETSKIVSIEWRGSIEQKNELESWAISRGKVSLPMIGDAYDSYDKATLESLAKNNHDVKAMTKLGLDTPGVEGQKWLNMAAIYGSSFVFVIEGARSSAIYPTEPEEVKRAALIDALTYKKMAELRNDYMSSQYINIDRYESQLRVALSEQDKAVAQEKSRLLYNDLEAQRLHLGLGKFDNSIPPLVEAYISSLDSQ